MEDKKEPFDFEAFYCQMAEDIKAGKTLVGQDGLFTPLLKRLFEALLEGGMDAHLRTTRKAEMNRRISHLTKNLSSPLGGIEIFSPRDRNATFEPQIVGERQHMIC